AHLHSTTGLDVDSTGRYVIASSPDLATESVPKYPSYPLTPGGPTNTGTISAIDLDPAPISVTIAPSSEPSNPTTQTSAHFSFSVSDSVSTVQCRLDSAPFGRCTSPTTQQYSSLGNGSHTFTVQAADAAGGAATDSYSWTVGTVPQNTSPPTISGTASPGQT